MDIKQIYREETNKEPYGDIEQTDNYTRHYVKWLEKQLLLHGVSQQRELLLAYHRYLTNELSMDLHEVWVDEHLKANNCG